MAKPVVEIHDYDTSWTDQFEREKQRIEGTLGHQALAIEHIGSTSVTGMPAKPIIDIMAGVSDLENALSFVKPLREINYEYVQNSSFKCLGSFFARDYGDKEPVIYTFVSMMGMSGGISCCFVIIFEQNQRQQLSMPP